MAKENSYTPLYRSEDNRILAGVSGGLGEYFKIDPNIIRLIFILLTVFGGSGIIIYIVLWLILPSKSKISSGNANMKENLREVKEKVREFAHDIKNSSKNRGVNPNNRNLLAYGAIFLGVIFLLDNFGFGQLINLDKLWPVFLVALGVAILLRK